MATTTKQTVQRLKHLDSILGTYNPREGTLTVGGNPAAFAMDYFHIPLEEMEADESGLYEEAERLLERFQDLDRTTIPDFCDTAACALGAAGLDPDFQAQGLRSIPNSNEVEYRNANGERYIEYRAGAEFFGITYGESEYLFGCTYPGGLDNVEAPQVQRRVRELIREYKAKLGEQV